MLLQAALAETCGMCVGSLKLVEAVRCWKNDEKCIMHRHAVKLYMSYGRYHFLHDQSYTFRFIYN